MRLTAATGPPHLGVQRRFETNRLAKDFQARAYEGVMPLVRGPKSEAAAQIEVDVALAERGLLSREGVAA
jgi:hypothetical protein